MKKVLVTGANGQLGRSIRRLSESNPDLEFLFTDRDELNITDPNSVSLFFRRHQPDYCVNCAAYTQVDLAEKEPERCFEINVIGTTNLVEACSINRCCLIHISTDFVFDGNTDRPYVTSDIPNPINVYGQSKLESERIVQEGLKKYFILRTSWVYSEFGNNFVKTMLRVGKERSEIRVVNDQIGSPTYSGDLADVIIKLITAGISKYGVYHYTNQGEISWFEFAKAIFSRVNHGVSLIPVDSSDYNSPAKRPKYSVLDNKKIQMLLDISPIDYTQSLNKVLDKLG